MSRQNPVDTLPLFRAPDIRTEAPSAPGSESSRRAARTIISGRKSQYRAILLTLAAAREPLSRDQISHRTQIQTSSLCGRLSELRGAWIEVIRDACISDAGLTVDGYELTKMGRDSVR